MRTTRNYGCGLVDGYQHFDVPSGLYLRDRSSEHVFTDDSERVKTLNLMPVAAHRNVTPRSLHVELSTFYNNRFCVGPCLRNERHRPLWRLGWGCYPKPTDHTHSATGTCALSVGRKKLAWAREGRELTEFPRPVASLPNDLTLTGSSPSNVDLFIDGEGYLFLTGDAPTKGEL
jgi:hypothetical protein